MKKLLFICASFIILSVPTLSSAHPGNTAADGCHYCRTNCYSWGVGWNVRHCHNRKEIETTYGTQNYSNGQRNFNNWSNNQNGIYPNPLQNPSIKPYKTPKKKSFQDNEGRWYTY